MKRRNTFKTRRIIHNTPRRRLMLKRLHHKIMIRRQQYQTIELFGQAAENS